MKIACGYLNQASIENIGGYGKKSILFNENSSSYEGLIKAVSITPKKDEKKSYLGYQFAIPKPKILAIVNFDQFKFQVKKEDLRSNGIYFFDSIPAKKDFDFILINDNPQEIEKLILEKANFPIRTICYTNNNNQFSENQKIITIINDDILNEIKKIVNAKELINYIYTLWIRLKYRINKDNRFNLVLNPFDNDSGTLEKNMREVIEQNAIEENELKKPDCFKVDFEKGVSTNQI